MKHTKTLITAILMGVRSASAQPTLTAATNGLQPGLKEEFHYRNSYGATTPGPGPAGANQVWDYSALSPSYTTTNTFGACAATPYCSGFPGTTVAEDDSLAFGSTPQKEYTYYQSTSTMLASTGNHINRDNIYSQPEVILTFPFTYLSQAASAYSYPDPFTAGHYTTGIDSVLADGYGTLKTPAGTFSNVLRVKTVRTYADSSASGKTQNERDYFYRWYSTQAYDYLFTLQDYEPAGGSGLLIGYTVQLKLGVATSGGLGASLEITPNPAIDKTHLHFNLTTAQAVHTMLTDMTGRTVYDAPFLAKAGDNSIEIDVSTLSPGVYLLRLNAGNDSVMRKIVVQ